MSTQVIYQDYYENCAVLEQYIVTPYIPAHVLKDVIQELIWTHIIVALPTVLFLLKQLEVQLIHILERIQEPNYRVLQSLHHHQQQVYVKYVEHSQRVVEQY